MEHDTIVNTIPFGDVVLHSGDFSNRRFRNFFFDDHSNSEMLQKVNRFFEQLPHRYKIFVGGNHDTFLTKFTLEELQQRLPEVIYLQDSSVVCDGVKFYGTPWTIHSNKIKTSKAFTASPAVLQERWAAIDSDTDVLITHTPPYGMLDYSRSHGDNPPKDVCQYCDTNHPGVGHAGCRSLREALLRNIRYVLLKYSYPHGYGSNTQPDDP
jgi:Icc-related predicted phosphoesterase